VLISFLRVNGIYHITQTRLYSLVQSTTLVSTGCPQERFLCHLTSASFASHPHKLCLWHIVARLLLSSTWINHHTMTPSSYQGLRVDFPLLLRVRMVARILTLSFESTVHPGRSDLANTLSSFWTLPTQEGSRSITAFNPNWNSACHCLSG